MLQRAASNAYSWWYASHIRTKQSKWLETSLQDMEEMVTSMLKIIEEDADSFAKRAEMYYKRRPELTGLVQETYKAYRALADRFDHISGALQKANNTIATVFPDQPFGIEDEEDGGSPTMAFNANIRAPPIDALESVKALRDQKNDWKNQMKVNKNKKKKRKNKLSSANEAEDEIDKLQKEILILQTEKEFIKCSYEDGISQYWDKHNKIAELQEKLSSLQDEFGEDIVIEDDEARALMTVTAVKSCVGTLISLYERQIKNFQEAQAASRRIKDAKQKLGFFRRECGLPQFDDSSPDNPSGYSIIKSFESEINILKKRSDGLESICDKVKKNFEMESGMSILNIADDIDDHVRKVVHLEAATSTLTAQLEMLDLETNELHAHLHFLVIKDFDTENDEFRNVEDELRRIEETEKTIEEECRELQVQFMVACNALNVLSDRLQFPEEKSKTVIAGLVIKESISNQGRTGSTSTPLQDEKHEIMDTIASESAVICIPDKVPESAVGSIPDTDQMQENNIEKTLPPQEVSLKSSNNDHESNDSVHDDGSLLKWQELFLHDLEDREKLILAEYTTLLQNYKEIRRKLTEADKKNQNNLFQTMANMRDLKNSIVMKDEEIRSLKQQLQFVEATWAESVDVDEDRSEMEMKESRSSSLFLDYPDRTMSDVSIRPSTNQVETDEKNYGAVFARRLSSKKSMKLYFTDGIRAPSPIEEKFRRDIDQLLEDNLGFWSKLDVSFQQMQRFEEDFEDVDARMRKLMDKKEGEYFSKGSAANFYRQLNDLYDNLSSWIEENGLKNEELHTRFASISSIEEEILRISKDGGGGGVTFTAYEALKFQGEVVNLREENNKVASDLRVRMDHVRNLQGKVKKLIEKLKKKFELLDSNVVFGEDFTGSSFKSKIPLSAFLFGMRVKKKKPSIFACMHPGF